MQRERAEQYEQSSDAHAASFCTALDAERGVVYGTLHTERCSGRSELQVLVRLV